MLKKISQFILIALLTGTGLALGVNLALKVYESETPLQAARLYAGPKEIAPFSLTDYQGGEFGLDKLKGRWHLVFFGFTFCPDVCPLEMAKLKKVLNLLEDENNPAGVRVLFISIDPERDTPGRLETYVHYYHQDILALTGENQALGKIAANFQAPFLRFVEIDGKPYTIEAGHAMPKNSGKDYLVNHSAKIFIVNKAATIVGYFERPHNVEKIVHDLKILTAE